MGHWIKFYSDGSQYIGDDVSIRRKEKSWTKSRNGGIIAVSFVHLDQCLRIEGPGEFWQSDTFEAVIGSKRSQLVARRIERQITKSDGVILIHRDKDILTATVQGSLSLHHPLDKTYIVMDDFINQWLVLEMDTRTKELRHYFSVTKI
jgi:hypothetical protein